MSQENVELVRALPRSEQQGAVTVRALPRLLLQRDVVWFNRPEE